MNMVVSIFNCFNHFGKFLFSIFQQLNGIIFRKRKEFLVQNEFTQSRIFWEKWIEFFENSILTIFQLTHQIIFKRFIKKAFTINRSLSIVNTKREIKKNSNNWNENRKKYISQSFGGIFCIIKDRKSTRLNSSHVAISYAVFCLKTKKKQ